jgi:hypothetical protein
VRWGDAGVAWRHARVVFSSSRHSPDDIARAIIDLLCYADGFLVTPDDLVVEEIHAALDTVEAGQFREIWFHGDGVHRV